MQKLKKWLLVTGGIIILLVILYALFAYQFLDLFVDFWWFSSLNYEGYFLLRLFYRYVSFLGVFVAFFLIFFLNFWVASRYLGVVQRMSENGDEKRTRGYQKLLKAFQSGSLKVYTPLSLLLAFPIALPFYEQWEKGLLFFFGPHAGAVDPTFGIDVGYYLFSLPVYQLLQKKLLIVFSCLFLGILGLYLVERQLLPKGERRLARGARVHLTLLFILAVGIQGWGFFLRQFELVYTDAHQPLFFGPGFVEMWIDMPLIWLSLLLMIVTMILALRFFHRRKGLVGLVVCGSLFAGLVWLSHTTGLKNLVHEWFVKPNEAIREKPYIAKNIAGTLAAYNLQNVEMLNYELDQSRSIITDEHVAASIRNIPVWDKNLLDAVYKQLQGIRLYYEFPTVDVDRYTVSGLYQQVYLAARELDITNLPDYAKNWMNRHLQYTHGYGVVMTPAAQGGDENMTWFIQDIPPRSDYGMEVSRSGIYYGFGKYDYAIVPNQMGEIDHPKAEGNVMTDYGGRGGIDISTEWRKLLFAIYFKEQNIVLTRKTTADSRVLLHRNVTERIRKLAPFFQLDSDPYLVALEDGLFWIQDGYIISNRYPNAQFYGNRFNYIRNSVKIIVDAYNGSVDFYMTDTDDPVIKAYRRIYPGLLKPIEKMPPELKAHLRYPKDLFDVQMHIFAKYHQENPEIFFRQEDLWEMSLMSRDDQQAALRPYYVTINLFDSQKHEFLLLSAMSPRGRNNLRALAVGGCDGENYGKIRVYNFTKGRQVYGPAQIDTLIDQDTEISQQLTLWDQAGSKVIRGRMIMLPVSNIILYIQPVYLSSATRLKIPELKRLIVSQGDIVAMAPSLEEAFQALEDKLIAREERQNRRFRKDSSSTIQQPEHSAPSPSEKAGVESGTDSGGAKEADPQEKNTIPGKQAHSHTAESIEL